MPLPKRESEVAIAQQQLDNGPVAKLSQTKVCARPLHVPENEQHVFGVDCKESE
jgi:hypothetical protein